MKILTILLGVGFGTVAVAGILFVLRDPLSPAGGVTSAAHSARLLASGDRSAVASDSPGTRPVTPPGSAVTSTRDDHLRKLARTHARADIAGAIAWLRTLSPADAALALDEIFAEVGRDDPAGVLALGQALGYGTTDGRLERIAQLWTEEEPAAAVAWVTEQPVGAGRDRLLARIALVRVRHDPAEAARLLGAMTDGSARDTAIAATIERLRLYDPAKADAWQSLLTRN